MYILFALLLTILITFFLFRKEKDETMPDETNTEIYRSLLNDRIDYYKNLN